jgi:hypothetical protein
MKTRFAFLLVLFAAVGCASKPDFCWYQPDKTIEEVKADYDECESKAHEEAARAIDEEYFDRLRSPSHLANPDQPAPKSKTDPALKAKAEWGLLYKQNAFAGCMQSRGYIQLRYHQIPPTLKTKELPLGAIAGQ